MIGLELLWQIKPHSPRMGTEHKEGQALKKHPVNVFSAGASWRVGMAVFSDRASCCDESPLTPEGGIKTGQH